MIVSKNKDIYKINNLTIMKKSSHESMVVSDIYLNLWESLCIVIDNDKNNLEYRNIINHVTTLLDMLKKPNDEYQYDLISAFLFTNMTLNQRECVIKIFMVRQSLVNLVMKICLVDYYDTDIGKVSFLNRIKITPSMLPNKINFHLGLMAKETEPGSEHFIKALKYLGEAVENKANKNVIDGLMYNLWKAAWHEDENDDISFQLFYADIIYDNLPTVNKEIANIFQTCGYGNQVVDNWLSCYTWLTSDRDGRPYDTNNKTEIFIDIMQNAIKKRYFNELDKIIDLYPNNELIRLIQIRLFNHYFDPNEMIHDLENCGLIDLTVVKDLILRVECFGFHYLQLEFRDNARMFAEVVNEIIPSEIIQEIIGEETKGFLSLSTSKKIEVLTLLQSDDSIYRPDLLWGEYLSTHHDWIILKSEYYKNHDYIKLSVSDPEYIHMFNAKNMIERFKLIKKYSRSVHIHVIAEAKGLEDLLSVLFIMEAAGFKSGVDVGLQPEDFCGAMNTIRTIDKIYTNPIYRAHLALRNNIQYIVFGPSDTGKDGGKAMHKANMQISNMHKDVALKYNIKVVQHVIVGYEHVRGNTCNRENLQEHGAVGGVQTRYMLGGFSEMRSHLLTKKQAVHCLKEFYFTHLELNNEVITSKEREKQLIQWQKPICRYQNIFYMNRSLPKLLKKLARFDIISITTKGNRPNSRILSTQSIEDDPTAIRAIPWGRAFLFAGIHTEAIGAGFFSKYNASYLKKLAENSVSFKRYVKHIAYAIARTDMNVAWTTLLGYEPNDAIKTEWALQFSDDQIQPAHCLLAKLDLEFILAKSFVYKALHGMEPINNNLITKGDILVQWPNLLREIDWKESDFALYKTLLQYIKKNPIVVHETKLMQDFFTGCLALLNTANCIFHPEAAEHILWVKAH